MIPPSPRGPATPRVNGSDARELQRCASENLPQRGDSTYSQSTNSGDSRYSGFSAESQLGTSFSRYSSEPTTASFTATGSLNTPRSLCSPRKAEIQERDILQATVKQYRQLLGEKQQECDELKEQLTELKPKERQLLDEKRQECDELKEELKELRPKLESTRALVEELKEERNASKAEVDEWQHLLESEEAEAARLRSENERLKDKIANFDTQLRKLREENTSLRKTKPSPDLYNGVDQQQATTTADKTCGPTDEKTDGDIIESLRAELEESKASNRRLQDMLDKIAPGSMPGDPREMISRSNGRGSTTSERDGLSSDDSDDQEFSLAPQLGSPRTGTQVPSVTRTAMSGHPAVPGPAVRDFEIPSSRIFVAAGSPGSQGSEKSRSSPLRSPQTQPRPNEMKLLPLLHQMPQEIRENQAEELPSWLQGIVHWWDDVTSEPLPKRPMTAR